MMASMVATETDVPQYHELLWPALLEQLSRPVDEKV